MYTPTLLPTPLAQAAARQHPALTPMAFVQAIMQAYAQRGMSPAAALQKAQITPDAAADASQRITALQFEALSHAAMRELDDEGLGWFARRLPWGSYGMLARASISSATLGLALARWCRHHGLLVDDLRLTLTAQGSTACLAVHEVRELGAQGALREFCLVSLLRNIHGVASWLIDEPLALAGARFPFAAPAHADVYRVLFPGPVAFGAPQACLLLPAHYLSVPLARDEAALQQMLERALPIQVRPYRRERRLAQRVRQLLAADCRHTAETLAQQLLLSTRSLHRQLHDEGYGLQQIKDEVRREHAIALLLRTNRPVKRVAQACGYHSDKSFTRAFRLWTGMSPAQLRVDARGVVSK